MVYKNIEAVNAHNLPVPGACRVWCAADADASRCRRGGITVPCMGPRASVNGRTGVFYARKFGQNAAPRTSTPKTRCSAIASRPRCRVRVQIFIPYERSFSL